MNSPVVVPRALGWRTAVERLLHPLGRGKPFPGPCFPMMHTRAGRGGMGEVRHSGEGQRQQQRFPSATCAGSFSFSQSPVRYSLDPPFAVELP